MEAVTLFYIAQMAAMLALLVVVFVDPLQRGMARRSVTRLLRRLAVATRRCRRRRSGIIAAAAPGSGRSANGRRAP